MRFDKKKMTPRLASDKLSRLVTCDSYLEKDFFLQLDFDPAVIAWRDHPFRIPYLYQGQLHRYTPDALVLRRRSSGLVRQVVEVKSTHLLEKDQVRRVIEVGERFCAAKGWEYKLMTERELRSGHLLENIKRIRRYRKQWPPMHLLFALKKRLSSMGGWAPIAELAGTVESLDADYLIPCIYSLLYHKVLFADLRSPLTPDTLVGYVLAHEKPVQKPVKIELPCLSKRGQTCPE
jgi:hypothetical protein